MKPILVPGVSNINFQLGEDEDSLLPARRVLDDGDPRIETRWSFEDPGELQDLAAGAVLELVMLSGVQPPVSIQVVPPTCSIHSVQKEQVFITDGLLSVEYRCPMCDQKQPVETGEPVEPGTPNVSIWPIEQPENPEETEIRAVTCRPCRWASFATDQADAERRAQAHISTERHQVAKEGAA